MQALAAIFVSLVPLQLPAGSLETAPRLSSAELSAMVTLTFTAPQTLSAPTGLLSVGDIAGQAATWPISTMSFNSDPRSAVQAQTSLAIDVTLRWR